ncbi:SurA N-terminal domain-containing protein [Paenibacillus abyssi]|uniref:Peptidylprolyl isomerase n=1 Tax=Paenibacillus abyssi TaxID=1340531 RepID=A0A917LEB0_9BACL|nr:SurA N-terminal domain-containing protein [Paenibacillus abyssi]GGG15198.1 hypothetical protein GCM10010916_35130 [Paenibacillus abyssi]
MRRKVAIIAVSAIISVIALYLYLFQLDQTQSEPSTFSAELDVTMSSALTDDQKISAGFDAIKAQLDQLKKDKENTDVVAMVDGAAIDKEKFVFYKLNAELTHALRGKENVPDDKTLLDNMINDELALQQAIQLGITASEEEVNDEIAYQRSVIENEKPASENEFVLKLMQNRIRITGVTDDEFWTSDCVRNEYKNAILRGKLMTELIQDGTVKDFEDYYAYKNDLVNKFSDRITYNLEL